MTIEKVGKKWRISQQRNGIRYRVSLDHKPTMHEAEELIRQKISETDPSNDARDLFGESCRKYIMIKSNILSPSTIRSYNGIIKVMSATIKNTKTAAITQELIQKEINDYSSTHSPKSTRNLHGFISAVLSVYRPSMVIRTTLPQKAKFEPYTPTEEDIEKVMAAVHGTRYEIPYLLGCYGLRRSEICSLLSSDLSGNMLHIHRAYVMNSNKEWVIKEYPKTTESNRTIYVDDDLARMIATHEGRMFEGHPGRLNDHLKTLLVRLNLPRFRFHDLRAYYASMAHALGVPDAYIMANGGWSSTHILNRTYKRTIEDMAAAENQRISMHLSKIARAGSAPTLENQ